METLPLREIVHSITDLYRVERPDQSFAGLDPTGRFFLASANAVGNELMRFARDGWPHLMKPYLFEPEASAYLPDSRLTDETRNMPGRTPGPQGGFLFRVKRRLQDGTYGWYRVTDSTGAVLNGGEPFFAEGPVHSSTQEAQARLDKLTTDGYIEADLAHPLPSDYVRMVNQTLWNVDERFPAKGPLSPQEWGYYRNISGVKVNAHYSDSFRLTSDGKGGQHLEFAYQPEVDERFVYEYLSSNWVRHPAGEGDAAFGSRVESLDDTPLFDWYLFKLGVQAEYDKSYQTGNYETSRLMFEQERSKYYSEASGSRPIVVGEGSGHGPMDLLRRQVGDTGFNWPPQREG